MKNQPVADEHPVKRFITPVAGARVINPSTGVPLSANGEEVVGNAEYWQRRLNDGDVKFDKSEGRTASERTKAATA